jgi:hypothetical protein
MSYESREFVSNNETHQYLINPVPWGRGWANADAVVCSVVVPWPVCHMSWAARVRGSAGYLDAPDSAIYARAFGERALEIPRTDER